jgi:hypothetical protein
MIMSATTFRILDVNMYAHTHTLTNESLLLTQMDEAEPIAVVADYRSLRSYGEYYDPCSMLIQSAVTGFFAGCGIGALSGPLLGGGTGTITALKYFQHLQESNQRIVRQVALTDRARCGRLIEKVARINEKMRLYNLFPQEIPQLIAARDGFNNTINYGRSILL